jgi:hypothetical protein
VDFKPNYGETKRVLLISAIALAAFMGTGYMDLSGKFRPETNGTDFDVKVAVGGTHMTSLKHVLLAHEDTEIYKDGKESFSLVKFREITSIFGSCPRISSDIVPHTKI